MRASMEVNDMILANQVLVSCQMSNCRHGRGLLATCWQMMGELICVQIHIISFKESHMLYLLCAYQMNGQGKTNNPSTTWQSDWCSPL